MSEVAAAIVFILGLYTFWMSPARWRPWILISVSLLVGGLLWQMALATSVCLIAVHQLMVGRFPHWLISVILIAPLVAQKAFDLRIVGLSYATFLILGLHFDSKRENFDPGPAGRFAFGLFFPIIPVGPIERWRNLGSQLFSGRPFAKEIFLSGLLLIAFGIFKKLVIADRLSDLAVDSSKTFLHYSNVDMWFYMGLCLVQIYCDFSGVIDIARGVSRLFGIEVMDNFDRPYLAESVQDIWRRWHISLVSWLRDNVYNPIALRTRSVVAASGAVLLSVGLWHGVKWQMVVWALYWLALFWAAVFLRKRGIRFKLPVWLKRALCVLAMAFSTVFMIPGSLDELITVLGRTMFLNSLDPIMYKPLMISLTDAYVVMAGLAIVFVFETYMPALKLKYANAALPEISKSVAITTVALIFTFVYLTVTFGISQWRAFVYLRY